MKRFFTSESVTEGHPDKVCDRISDAVLDALLAQDPATRCACETTAEPGAVHIMGEITTTAVIDYEAVARKAIADIGYTKEEYGFDAESCAFSSTLHAQSPDIAMGVDNALEGRDSGSRDIGAGDQGMMFGYACDETESLMPLPIELAHALTRRLAEVRKSGVLTYLRPDGKAQVTVEYEGDTPVRVDTVVVSTQHDDTVSLEQLQADVAEHVICAAVPAHLMDENTRLLINPTGRFVLGGPAGDTGLTGRKIIVDTYGGYARHGGGAFSGKDPTKVDRSAAYMARNIAKTVVAAGAAKRCELQISYAIGVARPVGLFVDTFGTGVVSDEALCDFIGENFDLRPAAIIDTLQLRRPIYAETAAYGHLGRDIFPWEQVDADKKAALEAFVAANN